MKRLIAAVLSALALVGGTAHAMVDHGANSPYDSTTVEGDSARWGVGG